jgi:hypothetical protein
MKCIKAIRESKGVEVGDIKRVDDKTAINMVGLSWQYVSKTEWKNATRKQVETKSEPTQEQVEKKVYKKGERSEKHKNKQ